MTGAGHSAAHRALSSIATAKSALDALEAALRQLLSEGMAMMATPSAGCATESSAVLIEIGRAAQIAGASKDTVRRWGVQHGLGRKVGGRWLIDEARLRAFLRTDPNSPAPLRDILP